MACAREDDCRERSATRVPWPTGRGGRTFRTSPPSENVGRTERVLDRGGQRRRQATLPAMPRSVRLSDDGQTWTPVPPSSRVVLVPQLDTLQSIHDTQMASSQASDSTQMPVGVPGVRGADQGHQDLSEGTRSLFVGEAHPTTVEAGRTSHPRKSF